MEKQKVPFFKLALMQAIAGGSAGFIEVSLMQPLDVVKTRLQLQSHATQSTEMYYKGVFDCFAKVYRNEGILALWKGLLPVLFAETPKRAIKFVSFEQYKLLFTHLLGYHEPKPFIFALAGLGAGITESVFINPFEVVKITQQADTTSMKHTPTVWQVTKTIVRDDGFGSRGLYKGIVAVMFRSGGYNMFQFGIFHNLKQMTSKRIDKTEEFLRTVGIGFISATTASAINMPFDVAKSKIQGPQPIRGEIKYRYFIQTLRTIFAEEGVRGLFKGLVPKVARSGLGGTLILVIFDYFYAHLKRNLI